MSYSCSEPYHNPHVLCKRAAKALARLRVRAGSSEPSLLAHTEIAKISSNHIPFFFSFSESISEESIEVVRDTDTMLLTHFSET